MSYLRYVSHLVSPTVFTWANIAVCHGAEGKAAEAPCVALSPSFTMECPLASTAAISMKPLNSALWRDHKRERSKGKGGWAFELPPLVRPGEQGDY